MREFLTTLLLGTLATSQAGSVPAAGLPDPRPVVWMAPPSNDGGRAFRDLFERDSDWSQTRRLITGVTYADHWLDSQFTDAELAGWLPTLDRWGLKLGLEVGAVKPWGTTGARTFGIERRQWDRFRRLGGRIYSVAMDEPLSCTRESLHQSRRYAVEQTADFIELVRRSYPDVLIGDIEPYPSIPSDELLGFIDELEAELAHRSVRGLDFFRLDVDWMHFIVRDKAGQGGWTAVKGLEKQCRKRGVPFSLIYWAADYPSLKRLNRATEETWEASILRQGDDYAAVGGSPDEFMIESWLDIPSRSVPEGQTGTFARSVLDFCRRFRLGPRVDR
jgi:hypothetical protein